MNKNEMNGTCSTHVKLINVYGLLVGTLKERISRDLCVDERIILKLFLKRSRLDLNGSWWDLVNTSEYSCSIQEKNFFTR
jgi:hypothetical protein